MTLLLPTIMRVKQSARWKWSSVRDLKTRRNPGKLPAPDWPALNLPRAKPMQVRSNHARTASRLSRAYCACPRADGTLKLRIQHYRESSCSQLMLFPLFNMTRLVGYLTRFCNTDIRSRPNIHILPLPFTSSCPHSSRTALPSSCCWEVLSQCCRCARSPSSRP